MLTLKLWFEVKIYMSVNIADIDIGRSLGYMYMYI